MLKEIKINNLIPLLEFYKSLNSSSDHFMKALLNSFLHEVNRNSTSKLYALAKGMKAKVLSKRLLGQTKTVSHICLIEKK